MLQALIVYVKVHLKFWYIYIATIVLVPITLLITLFFMRGYSYYFGDGYLFEIFTFSTFSACTTPLLLIPNYQAANRISGGKSAKKLVMLTLLFQSVSFILFYFVGYMISEYLNRM